MAAGLHDMGNLGAICRSADGKHQLSFCCAHACMLASLATLCFIKPSLCKATKVIRQSMAALAVSDSRAQKTALPVISMQLRVVKCLEAK